MNRFHQIKGGYVELIMVTAGRDFGFARNQVYENVHLNCRDGYRVRESEALGGVPVFDDQRLGFMPEKGELVFAFIERNGKGFHATAWGLVEELDRVMVRPKPAPKVLINPPKKFRQVDLGRAVDLGLHGAVADAR